ncbi:c-type cytochrome domain-containing protein [Luteolibacter sp. LG18]|uniref:c-type cytochrome domain-containing protein n=1 Tax=Luteolibacter sp. LG18 TaxID=2819286 RepID=UPI002B2B2554|nr:hypothetical protein llg_44560 [Luteolibacter sp. LG18]
MAESSSSPRKPVAFTLAGLITIAGMVAMPLLAGQPDGDKVPDLVRFVGRFHPLVLHLPIGMVTLAILLEITRFFSKDKDKSRGGAGALVLGFAAASSVVAVILGFLLYQGGGWDESKLAEQHMWRGIFFAGAMVVTFLVKMWSDAAGGSGAWLSKAGLFGSSVVMGLASHDGGSLTHGENYLTEEAPAPIRKVLGLPAKDGKGKSEGDAPGAPAASPEQLVVYTDLVAPILEKRCTNCHNADKSKGKLRLDTYELIVKGGKNGSSIEPGNLEKSHLVARILLPKDDEEHMPPEEKPQVEEHELAVLKWWVASGADPKKTVAELNPPADVKAALAKLGGGSSKSGAVAKNDGGVPAAGKPAAPKAAPADPALKNQVAGFAKDFPGALTFESQQSPLLTFTAVSLREHLDDNAFQKLAPVVKHLVTADLSATKVTDKSVALLSGAENLRMVRLSETGVTDASIDALVKLPKLESVNLYGTAVTDGGVQKLASLPNLKHLYLWQTKVTPQAIDELKKKLPNCEIVTGA